MKFIFIVQGEGRGHMTQAISLFQILKAHGHEVAHVIVGKSKRRELPEFVVKNISAPITQLASPNFVTDRHYRSVSVWRTLFFTVLKLRTYLTSVNRIAAIVNEEQPDTIINFYDFLGGLYYILKNPGVTHIAIAHQFLLNHSQFQFPKGRYIDRKLLLLGNRLAGYRAKKLLCLSFDDFGDERIKKLIIVPPLLRSAIKTVSPSNGDHFLVYMVNHGYSEQVLAFHKKHPSVSIHCFWDKKDAPNELVIDDHLTFHRLDDDKFIQYMASCKGYLTTAGFESVCEAMFLGKPVLMVPVEGHFEQACNALDAERVGAGIYSDAFDLEKLLSYIPVHEEVTTSFHQWSEQTVNRMLTELTSNE